MKMIRQLMIVTCIASLPMAASAQTARDSLRSNVSENSIDRAIAESRIHNAEKNTETDKSHQDKIKRIRNAWPNLSPEKKRAFLKRYKNLKNPDHDKTRREKAKDRFQNATPEDKRKMYKKYKRLKKSKEKDNGVNGNARKRIKHLDREAKKRARNKIAAEKKNRRESRRAKKQKTQRAIKRVRPARARSARRAVRARPARARPARRARAVRR